MRVNSYMNYRLWDFKMTNELRAQKSFVYTALDARFSYETA